MTPINGSPVTDEGAGGIDIVDPESVCQLSGEMMLNDCVLEMSFGYGSNLDLCDLELNLSDEMAYKVMRFIQDMMSKNGKKLTTYGYGHKIGTYMVNTLEDKKRTTLPLAVVTGALLPPFKDEISELLYNRDLGAYKEEVVTILQDHIKRATRLCGPLGPSIDVDCEEDVELCIVRLRSYIDGFCRESPECRGARTREYLELNGILDECPDSEDPDKFRVWLSSSNELHWSPEQEHPVEVDLSD